MTQAVDIAPEPAAAPAPEAPGAPEPALEAPGALERKAATLAASASSARILADLVREVMLREVAEMQRNGAMKRAWARAIEKAEAAGALNPEPDAITTMLRATVKRCSAVIAETGESWARELGAIRITAGAVLSTVPAEAAVEPPPAVEPEPPAEA